MVLDTDGLATRRASSQLAALLQYQSAHNEPKGHLSNCVGELGNLIATDKERPRPSADLEYNVPGSLQPDPPSAKVPIDDRTLCNSEEVQKILKGENAILVVREMNRLRHGQVKELQRRWRIVTGSAMLFVLMPQLYILAQYIRAYLALSPSTWPLSDAANGSTVSNDAVMRSLALLGACLSFAASLFAIASGIYLRFTRSRSKARWFNLMSATITSFFSLGQSVLNLSLIAIWHNIYSASPSSPHSQTRDVAQRCRNNWALDMLWDAASQQRKLSTCDHDPARTLKAYYVAGSIRLVLFIVLCAIWLQCIARYHHTLDQIGSSNESIIESAELRKLLMDEEDNAQIHGETEKQTRPSYQLPLYTTQREDEEEEAAPRLDRFPWQRMRTEASQMDLEPRDAIINRHQQEVSAGGWSTGIVSHVWSLLRGDIDNTTAMTTQVDPTDQAEYKNEQSSSNWHERQVSKLGVRGWFNRDPSGLDSEECNRDEVENEQFLPPPPRHTRMSSQEKRAKEGRHAASSRLTHIDEERTDRVNRERQKRDQLDRIAYLASMGYNITPHRLIQAEDEGDAIRRSSSSAGDELPHMPELMTHFRAHEAQDGIDDEDIYWGVNGLDTSLAEDGYSYSARKDNLYVRTLGKLVRKMSDIKSVGSQERIDKRSRSNCQSGSI